MPAFAPAGKPALQDQSNPGFLCKFILTGNRSGEAMSYTAQAWHIAQNVIHQLFMKKIIIFIAGLFIVICCPAQKNNSLSTSPPTGITTAATGKPVKQVLQEIWKSPSFIGGDKYFWLYNYQFFRFMDANEFNLVNKEPYYPGFTIFAIADNSAGGEPSAFLMYDKDFKLFINYFQTGNKGPREIANSITEIFGTNDISKLLIPQKDKAFWSWSESSFNNSYFSNSVPKGVIPGFDLRGYFKDSLPGTFLTYHEEFSRKAFTEYFAQYKLEAFIPVDFAAFRTTDKKLLQLIDTLNEHSGEEVFYLVDFNPSGYWGVGNYKVLNDEQRKHVENFGLLSNAKEIAKLMGY